MCFRSLGGLATEVPTALSGSIYSGSRCTAHDAAGAPRKLINAAPACTRYCSDKFFIFFMVNRSFRCTALICMP